MNVAQICEKIANREISHPRYEECLNLTFSYLALAPQGSVVVLVGPTRVGKTTLTDAVSKRLVRAKDGLDRDGVPIVRVDATTTDQGFMSTRYMKLRILEELGHPMFQPGTYQPRFSMTESAAQLTLNRAFEALGTKYLIIDEAHHLLRTKSERLIGSSLDNLKCIGNENNVVVLLSGGYELLNTCFESAHLNGRLSLVDFGRYKPVAPQLVHFDRILVTVDELLPWSSGASLLKYRDLIYEGSLGCCGLVIGWVVRALATMHAQGAVQLKVSHFLDSRYQQQLEAIRQEIEMGEGLLTRFSQPLDPDRDPGGGSPRRGRSRRPGTRKPVRDKLSRDP